MVFSKADFKQYWILFSSSLALSLCVLSAPRVRATVLEPLQSTGVFQFAPSALGSPYSGSLSAAASQTGFILSQMRAASLSSYLQFPQPSVSSVGAPAGSNFFDGVSQFNLDPNFYLNCSITTFDFGTDWGQNEDGSYGWTGNVPVAGIGNCGSNSATGQDNGVIPSQALSAQKSIPKIRMITAQDAIAASQPVQSVPGPAAAPAPVSMSAIAF